MKLSESRSKQEMDISQELSHWRVVAASVRGKGHERVKQLCQDAHYWEILPGNTLVAAVADGAGSAALGKVGAIVAAQTAVEALRVKEAKLLAPDDETGWQLLLTKALIAAKTAVEAEAAVCQLDARDLATTLIIVVATPELIAAAQVGDGVAVVGDGNGRLIALTKPENGEYINETTFLISANALDAAQVTLWRGPTANVALLTDGLQMLALKMTEATPHGPFFFPLFRFLIDVKDQKEAKEQLVGFLRSERIANYTDDDLTLLLATLEG